jgi:hypothetical protein
VIASLLLAMAGPSLAAEIVVTNGDTFQLDARSIGWTVSMHLKSTRRASTKAATSGRAGLWCAID